MHNDAINKLFALAIEQSEIPEERELLEALRDGTDNIEVLERLLAEEDFENEEEEKNLYALISDMKLPEKIKLAMLGGKPARSILIRDTNRQVQMFVLQNPKLSDNEINEYARNTNLDDGVLREIGKNSTWMKNYSVKHGLVCNPKTPIDISIRWLKYLKEKDLRMIAKSKNIPRVIGTQANKLLQQRMKKSDGGGH